MSTGWGKEKKRVSSAEVGWLNQPSFVGGHFSLSELASLLRDIPIRYAGLPTHQDESGWFDILEILIPYCLCNMQCLVPASLKIVLGCLVAWDEWDTYCCLNPFIFLLLGYEIWTSKRCLGDGVGTKKVLMHDSKRE